MASARLEDFSQAFFRNVFGSFCVLLLQFRLRQRDGNSEFLRRIGIRQRQFQVLHGIGRIAQLEFRKRQSVECIRIAGISFDQVLQPMLRILQHLGITDAGHQLGQL